LVDTEIAAGTLVKNGFGLAGSPSDADAWFINTCGFLPSARDEAESYIKKAAAWKRKKPAARVAVVAGCLNQWDKKGVYPAKYPEIDLWLGADQIPRFAEFLAGAFEKKESGVVIKSKIPSFTQDSATPRILLTPPHTAYLKISDGCSNCCSYCAIPSIRGPLRCRDEKSILSEAANLVRSGVRELNIAAQDITAYKGESGGLAEMLKKMDKIKGDYWIRLLYAHPARTGRNLIDVMRGSEHIVPYLDLPLQHISDKILGSMGRKTKSSEIKKLIGTLRDEIPGIALRTTFITGFPGETDSDFEELMDFMRETRFERLGAFTFSAEPGTKAAALPDQVSPKTASERLDILMREQARISLERNRSLLGKELVILLDSVEDGRALGRTFMDAPDIDNSVSMRAPRGAAPGDFISAIVKSSSEYDLKVSPVR
jgi:ribosomal protein S12 methylthiotransferase